MAFAISSKVLSSAGADPVSALIAAAISAVTYDAVGRSPSPVDSVLEAAFNANKSVNRCAAPLVLNRTSASSRIT